MYIWQHGKLQGGGGKGKTIPWIYKNILYIQYTVFFFNVGKTLNHYIMQHLKYVVYFHFICFKITIVTNGLALDSWLFK